MPSAGAPHASSPLLTIEPASALLDEPVDIRLTGLVPGAEVTLTATMTDHFDRRWRSEATFTADDAGVVDVATQAPVAGSYDGVDPMGLFWSMAPEVPGGSSLPFRTPEPLVVALTAVAEGRTVAEARLERRLLASGVTDETVHDDGLAGRFFRPRRSRPVPRRPDPGRLRGRPGWCLGAGRPARLARVRRPGPGLLQLRALAPVSPHHPAGVLRDRAALAATAARGAGRPAGGPRLLAGRGVGPAAGGDLPGTDGRRGLRAERRRARQYRRAGRAGVDLPGRAGALPLSAGCRRTPRAGRAPGAGRPHALVPGQSGRP